MLKIDGYDEAIIGPAYAWINSSPTPLLVYDAEIIRSILMKRDGMSYEEAREFIEFNIEGAYMGEQTPIIVWPNDELWLDSDE